MRLTHSQEVEARSLLTELRADCWSSSRRDGEPGMSVVARKGDYDESVLEFRCGDELWKVDQELVVGVVRMKPPRWPQMHAVLQGLSEIGVDLAMSQPVPTMESAPLGLEPRGPNPLATEAEYASLARELQQIQERIRQTKSGPELDSLRMRAEMLGGAVEAMKAFHFGD